MINLTFLFSAKKLSLITFGSIFIKNSENGWKLFTFSIFKKCSKKDQIDVHFVKFMGGVNSYDFLY